MLPVIALVGRPNVGKSTLFNRLTRTQNALVADYPGLTRDRQYGEAECQGKPFMLIDTGGVGVEDEAVDALMLKQSDIAITEADIIFFVVDARSGLLALDDSIARGLRKKEKQVYVIVNKVDGLDSDYACAEFQSLGFSEVYGVSGTHGQGIADLLMRVTESFPEKEDIERPWNEIVVACVGRPNVGKSTLINRLMGEERVVVYDAPGTTRDSILIPFERDNKHYALVDTAGVRRRSRVDVAIEKFSIIKTLDAVRRAHVCLLLLDAIEGITDQDLHLLGFIVESGKALVIVVNKWDRLSKDEKESVREGLSRRLTFAHFARIRFISAARGTGVDKLFNDIDEAYASAAQAFSTPELTRLLQRFIAEHAPPLVNGRQIKLRYAHAGGQNPPVIVIHGNRVNALPDSYQRYLMNAFSKALALVGTPLKIELKGGENPYQGKKNPLSERQIRQRARLIKRAKRRPR